MARFSSSNTRLPVKANRQAPTHSSELDSGRTAQERVSMTSPSAPRTSMSSTNSGRDSATAVRIASAAWSRSAARPSRRCSP